MPKRAIDREREPMEQRSLMELVVGVGVGVGLGLVSARWGKPAHAAEGGDSGAGGAAVAEVDAELQRLVVDGRNSGVSFDEFHHLHYYLSEQTKELLINAAFLHLKQADMS